MYSKRLSLYLAENFTPKTNVINYIYLTYARVHEILKRHFPNRPSVVTTCVEPRCGDNGLKENFIQFKIKI